MKAFLTYIVIGCLSFQSIIELIHGNHSMGMVLCGLVVIMNYVMEDN